MTYQLSETVRNAMVDAAETATGAAPTLYFRSGALPSNCAAADAGTLLGSFSLPADWLSSGAAGLKQLIGTWAGAISAGGTIGHFRIKLGSVCHHQGDVAVTGTSGVAMTVDNPTVNAGQAISVTAFNFGVGGA